MKSGGFAAHENLDVINMATSKTNCFKLAAAGLGFVAPCFVNEQQSNSREQEDCSSC